MRIRVSAENVLLSPFYVALGCCAHVVLLHSFTSHELDPITVEVSG